MDCILRRKEQDDLQQKLRHLERKLIVGGENLLDKAEKQARLLQESEQELETRVKTEEQLKKQLQQKEVQPIGFRPPRPHDSCLGRDTRCEGEVCQLER